MKCVSPCPGYHGRDTDSAEVSSTTGPVEKRKFQQVNNDEVIGTSEDVVKKPKISFGFNKPTSTFNESSNPKPKITSTAAPISMKLVTQKPKEPSQLGVLPKASATVAKIFGADEEDDEEEMPPEAKMRMRNLGRETPTSAGPNSFGKTKRGFCDTRKVFDDLVIRPKKK